MNHHKIEQNGGFKLYMPRGFTLMGQQGGVATWGDVSMADSGEPGNSPASTRYSWIKTRSWDLYS